MSVNRVILLGRLGKDAEVKYGASGTAVCRFSLATNETFKNKAGDVEKHTEWHSVVAFGRLAEVCGEYLCKGKFLLKAFDKSFYRKHPLIERNGTGSLNRPFTANISFT